MFIAPTSEDKWETTLRIYKTTISLALTSNIFETDSFFILSLPEKYVSGVSLVYLLAYIWTFVTNIFTVYIHSNTLQLLTNVKVHV